MWQRTITQPVEIVGIGLHKGIPITMRLEPMLEDTGIVFHRSDLGVSIPARSDSVVDTRLATTIAKEGASVSTIEHLMSALFAYGIDNLRVVLDNEEVPVMDGSSIGFCMLLDEAGITEQSRPRSFLKVTREITVEESGKRASLQPAKTLSFDFTIDFSHPVIRKQQKRFEFSTREYRDTIARARTFGFLHEVQYLRSQNLALGGSLENAVVLDEKKILNPEGLRFKDEFVRHKILDAIGDLSLVGMPVIGAYCSHAGSHALNFQLVTALLEDADAYEIIEVESTTKAPASSCYSLHA